MATEFDRQRNARIQQNKAVLAQLVPEDPIMTRPKRSRPAYDPAGEDVQTVRRSTRAHRAPQLLDPSILDAAPMKLRGVAPRRRNPPTPPKHTMVDQSWTAGLSPADVKAKAHNMHRISTMSDAQLERRTFAITNLIKLRSFVACLREAGKLELTALARAHYLRLGGPLDGLPLSEDDKVGDESGDEAEEEQDDEEDEDEEDDTMEGRGRRGAATIPTSVAQSRGRARASRQSSLQDAAAGAAGGAVEQRGGKRQRQQA